MWGKGTKSYNKCRFRFQCNHLRRSNENNPRGGGNKMYYNLCKNIANANKMNDVRFLKKSVKEVIQYMNNPRDKHYKNRWRGLCEELIKSIKEKKDLKKALDNITREVDNS
jgi:hypothetical protein